MKYLMSFGNAEGTARESCATAVSAQFLVDQRPNIDRLQAGFDSRRPLANR